MPAGSPQDWLRTYDATTPRGARSRRGCRSHPPRRRFRPRCPRWGLPGRRYGDRPARAAPVAPAPHPPRREDPIWLRGVKYTFITAIEACVDVAQHLCAAEGWGPPADNGDAVRLLGEHGVLTPALARSVRQAVGFRDWYGPLLWA
jgi:Protein of unknown function DUF86